MPKTINYDFLLGAANMPSLKHEDSGTEFDIMQSAVAEYLINLPEVRQKIFDMARRKGFIQYDPHSQTWRGCRTMKG